MLFLIYDLNPPGCGALFLLRATAGACKKQTAAPAPLRLFLPQAAPQLRSPPPADVPPRLRRRPHTGALNHKLLLLPQRRTADLLPVGLPLCRGMIYTHPPAPLAVSPCRWRSRGKHSDRVLRTKQGAVFGAALRFLQAPSAVRSENRPSARGTRSAFCKRAPPRAAKTGHRNPGGLDEKSRQRKTGTVCAITNPTPVCL